MRSGKLSSALAFVIVAMVSGFCQIPNLTSMTATPSPGSGHDYIQMLNETVNPSNGSVSIQIHVPTPPGRKMALPFAFAYNTNGTYAAGPTTLNRGYSTDNLSGSGGWEYTIPKLSSMALETIINDVNGPVTCGYYANYMFTDLSGVRHPLHIGFNPAFPLTPPCGQLGTANTGGDDFLQAAINPDEDGVSGLRVADAEGTVYVFKDIAARGSVPLFIEDRNGNKIAMTANSAGAFSVTDTVGRTLISSSGFQTSSDSITVSGLSNPYTVQWGTVTANLCLQTWRWDGSPRSTICAGGTQPVVEAIGLPNGTNYTFGYDPNGFINKITYPAGGWVKYTWGINAQSEVDDYVSNLGILYAARHDWPAITKREVSFDGVHVALRQDFSYSTSNWTVTGYFASWGSKQTTVTTTDLETGQVTKTVYSYGGIQPQSNDPICCGYGPLNDAAQTIEQTIKYQDGDGNTLRTVNKSWADADLLQNEETVLENGKSSKVTYVYGIGSVLTEKDEYDFGQSSPARKTTINYQNFGATPLFASASSILNRPCQVITSDGSANSASEIDYLYDNGTAVCGTAGTPSVTAVSATSHDDVNYSSDSTAPRGNATKITRKCFVPSTGQTCPASSATFAFDTTGQSTSATDPLGNTTKYSFADSFESAPATNTNAYLTKITHPKTGTVDHIEQFSYAYADGRLTGATDQNGQQTTYLYSDALRRPTEVDSPGGGVTTITYSDSGPSPSVTTTKKITSSKTLTTTVVFDGMGHAMQTQLNSDSAGVDYVDTTYDGLGLPMTVSNPHRTTSLPTDGVTQSQYDALGRVTKLTKQDGSVATLAYGQPAAVSANAYCATATDEAGEFRTSCSDAQGRLIEVDEPMPDDPGVKATGSFAISGTLGSLSGVGAQPALSATGSVTINGAEMSTTIDPCYNPDVEPPVGQPPPSCPQTRWDSGSVSIIVNGHTDSAAYASQDTPASIAASLAAVINADSGASVTASASGASINLTARAAGAASNYSLSSSSSTNDAADFGGPSFTASTSGTNLTGGQDGTAGSTIYDSGTVTVSLGGFSVSAPYGQAGNGTAAQVAAALASTGALNGSGSPVTATISGATIALTYKTAGPSGNIAVTVNSNTGQSGYFSGPSFTSAGTSLAGGVRFLGPPESALFVTLYSYDALGNLLCVEQHGLASGTGCSAAPTSDATSLWRVRRFTYDSLSRLLTTNNPESGTINYTYDTNGNLLQKISPAPNQTGSTTQTISYCYDALNRVTGKAHSAETCTNGLLPAGKAVVSYTYDSGTNGIGHMTGLTDQAGSGTYSYDALGRILSESRTISSVTKNLSYTYNLDGSVDKVTYPSGAVITYTPDSAGRMVSAVDTGNSKNYVTSATYGPDSALIGFISGNSSSFGGITNSFSFNNRLQPCRMTAGTGILPNSCTDTNAAHVGNVYDISYDFHVGNGTSGSDNGNVWGVTNNKDTTRTQVFTYDALNRLTSVQNAGTDCSQTVMNGKTKFWGNSYSYDAWGNLLGKSVSKCSAENLSVVVSASNQIHSGNPPAQNQACATSPDYLYDAAGNMTCNISGSVTPQNYTYDQENRITGAAGYTYTYDADGNRVEKSNGSSGKLYWYMTPGMIGESDLTGNLKTEYVFFDGVRVARRDFPAGTISYYFSDHLKTASVVTDATGTILDESDYYPWGGELQFINNLENHYKFTGKERDDESSLDYFGLRYYGPNLGRFATPDPGNASAHRINPQSWNAYSYVNNHPLVLIDPNGLQPVTSQAGSIHGFAQEMNHTQHKVGSTTGKDAQRALGSLGDVKDFAPKNTGVFNMSSNRYVYTAAGGWIDMVHFVFYAGRAAQYKAQGDSSAAESAMMDGYAQEELDNFKAPWSAFSYEDLPSDMFGAIFGAQVFDPESPLTLAEQIEAYVSQLVPVPPSWAPNYSKMPVKDSRDPPIARNHSFMPMFVLFPEPIPKGTVTTTQGESYVDCKKNPNACK